ncbi:MAG: tyrosine recombinase XerC [Chloroflexi bacterium]|nr:tyrosine recombinase XerC [Chloroflexota bacterium]
MNAQPDSSLEGLRQQYRHYLQSQRDLAPATLRNYLQDLETFWRFLAERKVSALPSIDRLFLRAYLARLITWGYVRASIARKVSALRSLFRFLSRTGQLTADPTKELESPKLDRRLPQFIDHEGMRALLQPPSYPAGPLGLRDRAILELLYASGARLSEISSLTLDQLDLSVNTLRVLGKGSKERDVLIGMPARQALEAYLADGRPLLATPRSGRALFLNRYGGTLSRRTVQKLVKGYAIRAGLDPRVHTHTLRHTFATHMLDGGADLRVVQELMGHASPATTQIYTHVTQAQMRKVYLAAHPRARKGTAKEGTAP